MKYHRKIALIKLYSKRIKMLKIRALLEQQELTYSSYFTQGPQHPEQKQQEEEPDQDDDPEEFNIADYISSLPAKLRKEFRNNNPQLPELFFMTKAQKKKFFENVNQKFKKGLARAPQRKSTSQKKATFKKDFEIKGFNQHQKVVTVARTKLIHENYSPQVHFG